MLLGFLSRAPCKIDDLATATPQPNKTLGLSTKTHPLVYLCFLPFPWPPQGGRDPACHRMYPRASASCDHPYCSLHRLVHSPYHIVATRARAREAPAGSSTTTRYGASAHFTYRRPLSSTVHPLHRPSLSHPSLWSNTSPFLPLHIFPQSRSPIFRVVPLPSFSSFACP